MPLRKPRKGESQDAWMAYCMHELATSETDREQGQMVAICMSTWREHTGESAPKDMPALIADWQARIKDILAKQAPDPHKGESYDGFMARCKKESDEHACETKWNDWVRSQEAHPGPKDPSDRSMKKDNGNECPEPDDGESHEDFMDRCTDTHDEDECQMAWEDSQGDERSGANGLVTKTHAEVVSGMDFILSNEEPDRLGDVIVAEGWDWKNFSRNPIALFNHAPNFPIGRWDNLHIEKGELRGRLIMAPLGTSDRIDEIRKLIDAGILKAVSVGFRAIEQEPLDKKDKNAGMFGPFRYLKSELVETSLVAVPANPNALAIAKSLRISPETQDLIFVKHDKKDPIKRRGFSAGKHAHTSRNGKGTAMSLSQRISDIQAKLVEQKDLLNAHLEHIDDSNVSDADVQKSNEFNAAIAQLSKQHDSLVESEKLLAKTSDGNGHARPSKALVTTAAIVNDAAKPASSPAAPTVMFGRKKELDPIDYLVRSGVISLMAKSTGHLPDQERLRIYGDDEETKVVNDLILRAASAPAMTTVAGWAAELVQQKYTDLMPLLMPHAIMTRLAARGLALGFGQTGRIIIPTRNRTPTIAGSFVGEGQAIPVRQGAFSSQTLTPKKMAVISTWTREMSDHSIPAIEGLIREAIQVDTEVAIDSVLLDANPATVIRPAGLLNGVTVTTATAGGGINAIIGDITGLLGAITTNTYGNVRNPVWLVNPTDMLRASLLQAANTGIFPFREEIARGTLNGVPLIDSATVPAKTMILIDAADYVVVGGEAPRLEISDQATLHMEDTTPSDLVSGSPGVVATPQRSLFQTDSYALRMVLPLNWVQRRAGTIAFTQNVTW